MLANGRWAAAAGVADVRSASETKWETKRETNRKTKRETNREAAEGSEPKRVSQVESAESDQNQMGKGERETNDP